MKNIKLTFKFFSLLTLLTASLFITSCTQETDENLDEEFEVKESYTIYAPQDAFDFEDLIKLDDKSLREKFVDELNAEYENGNESELDERYCGNWTSWRSSGYTCEYYRVLYCTGTTRYQFRCFCTAYPACN
jgi:hypothetical protein